MGQNIDIILEGKAEPSQQRTYINLPFTVPEHVTRLDVRYEYSDQVGSSPELVNGNTVDIGIFDARGADFLASGFRGWSGSARDRFYIAHEHATPGYLYGPIQPGTWNITLGLYKIWEHGCTYKVSITLTVDDQDREPVQFPALLPLRSTSNRQPSADGWYKGELHCHSTHSDGDSEADELVQLAEARGLDFLALTDHNNITHQAALNHIETSIMLIPGLEVTTYYGHWNIWGDHGWIDFRLQTAEHMAKAIEEAVRRGYLVSCNHPRPQGPDWEFREAEGYHCVEIWNGPWPYGNTHCLAFWEDHLRQGKRLPAVGGSDTHFLKRDFEPRLGYPTTYVYVEGAPSPAKLLAGIRAGHAFVTNAPDGPQLYLTAGDCMMGDVIARPASANITLQLHIKGGDTLKLQLVGAEGVLYETRVKDADTHIELELDVADTPYLYGRLVYDTDELNAACITNPIYLD
ncbi:MAG: CehA/McbA family metallohydrolase [Anaerolineae bacterium]|nr:CehA/McbA family metallohydrolase [Anaerolineae bacterium]